MVPRSKQSPEPNGERTSRQRHARLMLTGGLALLALWMLWDFLPALVWAAVFAIATWPMYQRFTRLVPGQQEGSVVAPACFTLVIGLIFIVPLAALAVGAGREALIVIRWVAEIGQNGLPVPDGAARIPLIGASLAHWWQANLSDPGAAAELLGRINRSTLIEWTRSLGAQLVRRVIVLVFTLLTLFFLYREGAALARELAALAGRILGAAGERLAVQMTAAVRGTVNGLVLVGLGEGVLLGVAYAVVGLPRPALLGAVTGIVAMIPFGAPLIFIVGSLYLFGESNLGAASGLFVFGTIVVFVVDHVIRPTLIGGPVRLPFLWVLLGILGGLESFGVVGLFIGPVVMAALIALWREWVESRIH